MTDERPTPALYEWACGVWKAMAANATMEALEEGQEPTMVYEGHLTNLFRDLKVPNPYYTTVMRALKNQGSVLQIRRGGGSALSKWALVKEPDEETFKVLAERQTAKSGKVGILEQRVNDLQKLLRTTQDALYNVIERVEALEGRNGR